MARTNKELIDRLTVALGLALDEIHHPGAALSADIDITALCEGVIKEATTTNGLPQMIRDEIVRRAAEVEPRTAAGSLD